MLGKTSESYLSDHLYELIYELNAIAPSVLLAVLPQLEFKLKVIVSYDIDLSVGLHYDTLLYCQGALMPCLTKHAINS